MVQLEVGGRRPLRTSLGYSAAKFKVGACGRPGGGCDLKMTVIDMDIASLSRIKKAELWNAL